MIYLLGGKNKTVSRKAFLDLKKNYEPDQIHNIALDSFLTGNLKDKLSSRSLFGGKALFVLELGRDWKKFESTLVESLPAAQGQEIDALVFLDSSVPKTSKLYKAVTEFGGRVMVFEEEPSKELWHFLDALAVKDSKLAFTLLHSLLKAGESSVGLTMMIAYLTRNLLSTLYKNKLFESLTPLQKKKLQSAVKLFTEKELISLYGEILAVDMALKGSNLSEELLLTNLVFSYTKRHHGKITV